MTGLQRRIRAAVFDDWIEEGALVAIEGGVKVDHHTGNALADSTSLILEVLSRKKRVLNLSYLYGPRGTHWPSYT